jgi:hypothetical protein
MANIPSPDDFMRDFGRRIGLTVGSAGIPTVAAAQTAPAIYANPAPCPPRH